MKYLLFFILMTTSFCSYSITPIDLSETIYKIVITDTVKAEPIGGMRKFYQKWNKSAKYTKAAKKNKIQGKIHVKFLVNENGKLTDFEITKSLGYGLDEVIIEAIKKCGNWNPKLIDGVAFPEVMIMPFTFRLN